MRAPLAALAAVALLTAGCSDGGSTTAPGSTPSGAPASSPSAPADPFAALQPPRTPGVGSFDPAVSQRAYDRTQGLLALLLAEPGSLLGTGDPAVLEALTVPDPALSVAPILRASSRRALDLRPRFPRGVTLGTPAAEVVRSSYRADEVRGAGGEQALRISWDGSVRYRVSSGGRPREVAYALTVSFVYEPIPEEPRGLRLVQAVPGSMHAAPVLGACLAKGLLVPGPGLPTASDFGAGPWPAPDTRTPCPV